ncbi:MAG: TVP38/TMEM64 family protein [Haloferacaceae archaeon]
MDRRVRFGVGGALVLAVGAAALVVGPDRAVSRLAWLAGDPVRFGLALLALSLVRPLFAWPTTLIAVAAGYGFGPVGIPFALALITLTSVPPYAVARRARGGGRVATTGERLAEATGELRAVTASRLVPAPSDVVSVAAGVAGISPGAFVVGTAFGEVPWAVAGTLAGSSMEALGAGGLDAVFDPRVVGGAAAVALALLAGPAYRHFGETTTGE